jgi:hypothetical protein
MKNTNWATIFVTQAFNMTRYQDSKVPHHNRTSDPYHFNYVRFNGEGFSLN